MSDLSRILEEVYTSPAPPSEVASESALERAFADWVPGPQDDASPAERSLFAMAFDEPATDLTDAFEFDDRRAAPPAVARQSLEWLTNDVTTDDVDDEAISEMAELAAAAVVAPPMTTPEVTTEIVVHPPIEVAPEPVAFTPPVELPTDGDFGVGLAAMAEFGNGWVEELGDLESASVSDPLPVSTGLVTTLQASEDTTFASVAATITLEDVDDVPSDVASTIDLRTWRREDDNILPHRRVGRLRLLLRR